MSTKIVEDGKGVKYSTKVADVEVERELAEIKAKAIADGTFMKAPNGKDTNLNEEQWLHVRLKSFKKWFGDWENWFKKNFLLNGKPVATLTGEEFARVEGKSLTDQVEEYFNSIGNKAVSPLYGDVVLDRRGADDSLAHGMGRNKAVAYGAVKEVIEKGILIDYHENHKNRGYDSAVVVAPIEIKGERYFCYVTITRMNGTNRYYLHEVWTQKNLTNVGSNAVQGQPSHLQGTAKILQNILNASDDVSKVVDENGEPKEVWHGGQFAMSNFVPLNNMHFGTKRAALERILDQEIGYDDVEVTKGSDDRYKWKYTNLYEGDGATDAHSEQSFATEVEAYEDAVSVLAKDVVVKPYFLNIRNIEKTSDAGSDWSDTIDMAFRKGSMIAV
jgi:hypothetical protein